MYTFSKKIIFFFIGLTYIFRIRFSNFLYLFINYKKVLFTFIAFKLSRFLFITCKVNYENNINFEKTKKGYANKVIKLYFILFKFNFFTVTLSTIDNTSLFQFLINRPLYSFFKSIFNPLFFFKNQSNFTNFEIIEFGSGLGLYLSFISYLIGCRGFGYESNTPTFNIAKSLHFKNIQLFNDEITSNNFHKFIANKSNNIIFFSSFLSYLDKQFLIKIFGYLHLNNISFILSEKYNKSLYNILLGYNPTYLKIFKINNNKVIISYNSYG